MRVKIAQVLDDGDHVALEAPHGSLVARWGEGSIPEGGEFDVEVEVEPVLEWRVDIVESSKAGQAVWFESARNHLMALVDTVDEESGILGVRLGRDLAMVEISGNPRGKPAVGETVVITADKDSVVCYPYEL